MDVKKFLVSIILYYIFILLQASFLVHFSIFGLTLNLILISVIIWNIIEKPGTSFGLLNAVIGGFYLDLFSTRMFGLHIITLLVLAVFIKFVLKKYVRIPIIKKN